MWLVLTLISYTENQITQTNISVFTYQIFRSQHIYFSISLLTISYHHTTLWIIFTYNFQKHRWNFANYCGCNGRRVHQYPQNLKLHTQIIWTKNWQISCKHQHYCYHKLLLLLMSLTISCYQSFCHIFLSIFLFFLMLSYS